MPDVCMFDIMALPEESLRKALPKVSVKMLTCLLSAYPRALGRTMLVLLSESMSPETLNFLKDEMNGSRLPTIEQIRDAEMELIKTIHDENLFPHSLNS